MAPFFEGNGVRPLADYADTHKLQASKFGMGGMSPGCSQIEREARIDFGPTVADGAERKVERENSAQGEAKGGGELQRSIRALN